MAWRDSRGSRARLLLFLLSMVLGVAALVAINSFGDNLRTALDDEAGTLLGADLLFERSAPFTPRINALADSLGGQQSRRVTFNSMAYFPRVEGTRLATVRAGEAGYPYYGALVTQPAEAAARYLETGEALVDGGLLDAFDVAVGDSVQVGAYRYRIAGRVVAAPREVNVQALFSPRVYIPLVRLDSTLLSTGSRATYERFFFFGDGRDVETMIDPLQPALREARVRADTVEELQGEWDTGLDGLYRFLNLTAFIALLLGGLGIASSVHVFVQSRLNTVAVLRCLGAPLWKTYAIYLGQALAMGVLAGAIGGALATGVLLVLPRLLADFLPVEVAFRLQPQALVVGIGLGVGVTLLFALLPLLAVRRASPLRALRAVAHEGGRDPLRWLIFLLIAAAIVGFAYLQAPSVAVALGYAGGVLAVFGGLALVAKGLSAGARRLVPRGAGYVVRQGVANLYRPRNQTVLLLLALGLGVFLLLTLLIVERTLVGQFETADGEGQPNLVLFDVQPSQAEGVAALVAAQNLPVLDTVPIVTMRVQSINGLTVDAMRADSTLRDSVSWAHVREYRSTYRDRLIPSETLLEGEFVGSVAEGTEVVPISIERDVAGELGVALGDTLVWSIQGRAVTTTIASIRAVDWRQLSTNFFVVFPAGVLEKAPQTLVLLTRSPDATAGARLQAVRRARFSQRVGHRPGAGAECVRRALQPYRGRDPLHGALQHPDRPVRAGVGGAREPLPARRGNGAAQNAGRVTAAGARHHARRVHAARRLRRADGPRLCARCGLGAGRPGVRRAAPHPARRARRRLCRRDRPHAGRRLGREPGRLQPTGTRRAAPQHLSANPRRPWKRNIRLPARTAGRRSRCCSTRRSTASRRTWKTARSAAAPFRLPSPRRKATSWRSPPRRRGKLKVGARNAE